VIGERPYDINAPQQRYWIHDFELEHSREGVNLSEMRDTFSEAFKRIWAGEADNDAFNRLIISAGLDWREVAMLRGYARYLKQTLESKLSQSVPPTGQFQARSVSFSRDLAAASGADYIITGSYWEETDRLRVLAQCRELKSGTVVASTSVEFASDLLPAAMQLKPENFQSAMAQQMAFAQQIIDSDQFQLEVWTDRGQDAILYGQGELMEIYLRSNRPCYVRLIYILADGQKTLLLDNLPINITHLLPRHHCLIFFIHRIG